jgi:SAM-dependent methyltransferase
MANRTIDYYNNHVSLFNNDTVTADMSDAQDRFLAHLQKSHPGQEPCQLHLLDFGCGSGRDTKFFLDQGYLVSALDGSAQLAKKASLYTGIPVQNLLFQDFHEKDHYDGIWACASILHLTKEELPSVFQNIYTALRPNGIFYTSFKYGNFTGYRKERYYTDLTEDTMQALIHLLHGSVIEEEWISSDVRPGRDNEKWINVIVKKE